MTAEEQIEDLKKRVNGCLDFMRLEAATGDLLSLQETAEKLIRYVQCLQVLQKVEQRLSPLCEATPEGRREI